MLDLRRFVAITITPELALERRIAALGEFLLDHGFILHSASLFSGSTQFMDLIYADPGHDISKRAEKLPGAFLSYSEYSTSAALALLQSMAPDRIPAYSVLQQLKGPSIRRNRADANIRNCFPMTMYMYSYVHVPDDTFLGPLISYAFPPQNLLDHGEQDRLVKWDILQDVLSPASSLSEISSPAQILAVIINRCFLILQLSGIESIAGFVEDALALMRSFQTIIWPPRFAGDTRKLFNLLKSLHEHLPVNSYAGRRLRLVVQVISLLANSSRWDLAGVAELPCILGYSGIPVSSSELQVLRAWMAYGPEGERLPLRCSAISCE